MRLRLGIGMVFLPFIVILSTEYGLAANYGVQLAEIVAGIVWPLAAGTMNRGDDLGLDEAARPAVEVPLDDDETLIVSTEAKGKKGRPSVKQGGYPKSDQLPSIYVKADTVLRLANSGMRPTGKPVTADGERPAGVQVFGANALGIGVRDGDVITRVSGVAVTSPNQVIALVIAARGAHQSAISAQMYRGKRRYTLTVEQPYLPKSEAPTTNDAGTPASEGLPAAAGRNRELGLQ